VPDEKYAFSVWMQSLNSVLQHSSCFHVHALACRDLFVEPVSTHVQDHLSFLPLSKMEHQEVTHRNTPLGPTMSQAFWRWFAARAARWRSFLRRLLSSGPQRWQNLHAAPVLHVFL